MAGQSYESGGRLGSGPLAAIVRNTENGLRDEQGIVRLQVQRIHRRQKGDLAAGRD